MKKIILLLFLLFSFSFCLDFKVATYNVENLFDHKNDGSEYPEFKPNSKYWDQKASNTKLQNTIRVIKDINADIIALQEIENRYIIKQLAKNLKYPYYEFNKQNNSAIGVGILSNFPIKEVKIHKISSNKSYRNILQCDFLIENAPFTIFVNHWNSKRKSESHRIKSAHKLTTILNDFQKYDDYIILGDLNENYDEFLNLKYDKKLNDTQGITGINHLLNTTINGNFVEKNNIFSFKQKVHFNPWIELNKNERFSTKFKKSNNTPDHILLSVGLFDNHGISYTENSFTQFKPSYLFKNNQIVRWNKYKSTGYSDHLPIMVQLTTEKIKKDFTFVKEKQNIKSIADLYKFTTLDKPIILDDIFITYKFKKNSILKQKNSRSIRYYGNKTAQLELNKKYKLKINALNTYHGNLEIKDFSIIETTTINKKQNGLLTDGDSINLFDEKYQNEVITNLQGIYKNHKLYYGDNQSIYLYFHKNVQLPNNNVKITIKAGVLTKYKSKTQLTIFSSKDFSLN